MYGTEKKGQDSVKLKGNCPQRNGKGRGKGMKERLNILL
jgi:hypothetical protein